MSEEGVVEDLVKIPEFKTQEDFRDWVKSLDDKQIQSFKTKDWLSLYDNLDKYTRQIILILMVLLVKIKNFLQPCIEIIGLNRNNLDILGK